MYGTKLLLLENILKLFGSYTCSLLDLFFYLPLQFAPFFNVDINRLETVPHKLDSVMQQYTPLVLRKLSFNKALNKKAPVVLKDTKNAVF